MGFCLSKENRNVRSRELAEDTLPVVSDLDISKHGRVVNKNLNSTNQVLNESDIHCDCCTQKTHI